jgi:hypothetical protein
MSREQQDKISIVGFWVMAVALGTFQTYIIMITR